MDRLPFGLLAFFLAGVRGYAEIRLPAIIGSHMVLQRNSEATLWGWCDPAEKFSISADWLPAPIGSRDMSRDMGSCQESGHDALELSRDMEPEP